MPQSNNPTKSDLWFYFKIVFIQIALLILGIYLIAMLRQYRFDRQEEARARANYDPGEVDLSRHSKPKLLLDSHFSTISPSLKALHDEFETTNRADLVRNMTLEAWNVYTKYSWGEDALRPMTREAAIGVPGAGLTIISAMSTLWIMGLKEEFEKGKVWIQEQLNFAQINHEIKVQSAVNDYIGGLLSCYALTGDEFFLQQAKQIAQILDPAYQNPTGLPYETIIPKSGAVKWTNASLSHLGGQQLEYRYLGDMTQNQSYIKRANKMFEILQSTRHHLQDDKAPFFVPSSIFYSYLVKSYLQSNRNSVQMLNAFQDAMTSLMQQNQFIRQYNGYTYLNELDSTGMDASGCLMPAVLMLGTFAINKQNNETKEMARLAEQVMSTCYHVGIWLATQLLPQRFGDDQAKDTSYNLNAELPESYFTMWRLTKNEQYRDQAWELVQEINRNCRLDSGYSTLVDVNVNPAKYFNLQPAHFLGGTLKFLYLTFAKDTELSLFEWIFNAAGHPLPICAQNKAYGMCTATV